MNKYDDVETPGNSSDDDNRANEDFSNENSFTNSVEEIEEDLSSGSESDLDDESSIEDSPQEVEEYQENPSDEDPDNPRCYDYSEPKMYNAEYVLNWIGNVQFSDDEYIDYPEIDYDDIANRLSEDDIQGVISKLMKADLDNKNFHNFVHIAGLDEIVEIYYNDDSLIEDYLFQAIDDQNTDVVDFCVKAGAYRENAIQYAVKKDKAEILEHLNAEVDEELLEIAINRKSIPYDTLNYFLSDNFPLCFESILDLAIKNDNEDLVDAVLNHAELDIVYDLVKGLYKFSETKYFAKLFERFDTSELLDEIYEQDKDLSFYKLVLEQAKKYFFDIAPEIDVHELFVSFEEKLKIDTDLLCYPEQFNGCLELKHLRTKFNENAKLNNESKLGTNFIGVYLSSCNRYLSQTPIHKFKTQKAETYVRSADNPLSVFVGASNAQFEPHPDLPEAKVIKGMGREANLGLYKNTMESMNNFKKLNDNSKEKLPEKSIGDSKLYDDFLIYKRNICEHIANNFTKLNSENANLNAIRVGYYHRYPCLMVFIKKSTHASKPTPAALEAWTQMVISYFVGLVNYKAQKKNIDIELVRRSSFGFLTPTIAPCGQSFRVNVGIIPTEYADLLLECLCILNEVLTILNCNYDALSEAELDVDIPKSNFILNENYKNYITKAKQPNLLHNNILELIWAKIDKGGRTGAYNLVRTVAARDGLGANVYKVLLNTDNPDIVDYTNAFLNAMQWGFSKIKVTAKNIGFDQGESVAFQKILTSHTKIKDEKFFTFIKNIINSIDINNLPDLLTANVEMSIAALTACRKNKTLENLYFNLELLNELFFGKVIYTFKGVKEDEYGSDSEIEVTKENSTPLFAKKIIVPNGMRAILTALHAGAGQLHQNYLTGTTKPSLFLLGAYYETPEALDLLKKFSLVKDIFKAEIVIYDINACQSKEEIIVKPKVSDFANTKVLIIDSTSATVGEHHFLAEAFKQQKEMKYLLFVSSGLKNEQGGGDKNPYGTIRIFTKEKNRRENIISFIKKYQPGVKSGVSHHYRRTMKKIGFTPTNKNIIFFSPGKDVTSTTAKKNKKSFTTTTFRKK